MNKKVWISIFFIILFAEIAGYMGLNYAVDPLGYFTVKKGTELYDADQYARAIKSEYVHENADAIQGAVIGGSKSGVLSTKLLSQYTGKNYYNFYVTMGNFADYLTYSTYLVENTDISELTLHLSSFEVRAYNRETRSSNYEIPAIVNGNGWDRFTELLSYLMSDLPTVAETIADGNAQDTWAAANELSTGERIWFKEDAAFEKDPKKATKNRVLGKLEQNLKKAFNGSANSFPAFDDNIAALRKIKALCDEHGVTLKVVIGASFIGERDTFECERYYSYLSQIVDITDVWLFDDFNDINLNPYNFVNRNHYSNAVADLMVNTMYGQEHYEGFGVYLTSDNIYSYLDQRRADFQRYKEEFETTGTIALQGMEDESYIPRF